MGHGQSITWRESICVGVTNPMKNRETAVHRLPGSETFLVLDLVHHGSDHRNRVPGCTGNGFLVHLVPLDEHGWRSRVRGAHIGHNPLHPLGDAVQDGPHLCVPNGFLDGVKQAHAVPYRLGPPVNSFSGSEPTCQALFGAGSAATQGCSQVAGPSVRRAAFGATAALQTRLLGRQLCRCLLTCSIASSATWSAGFRLRSECDTAPARRTAARTCGGARARLGQGEEQGPLAIL